MSNMTEIEDVLANVPQEGNSAGVPIEIPNEDIDSDFEDNDSDYSDGSGTTQATRFFTRRKIPSKKLIALRQSQPSSAG